MTGPHDEETPVICLGGCRRQLRDPESVSRGYGPDCWRKLHGRPGLKPRRPAPATEAGPGQGELPLEDQLELWTPT